MYVYIYVIMLRQIEFPIFQNKKTDSTPGWVHISSYIYSNLQKDGQVGDLDVHSGNTTFYVFGASIMLCKGGFIFNKYGGLGVCNPLKWCRLHNMTLHSIPFRFIPFHTYRISKIRISRYIHSTYDISMYHSNSYMYVCTMVYHSTAQYFYRNLGLLPMELMAPQVENARLNQFLWIVRSISLVT